jgi:hypothetical protein
MRFTKIICILIAVAALIRPAGADNSNLPVGDWSLDWKINDPDKGVAFLILSNDFSCVGYGYSGKSFGIFPITGSWTLDPKDRAEASLVFDISTGGRALSVRFKVKNNGRIIGTGRNPSGLVAKFSGRSPSDVPDMAGTWAAERKQKGDKFLETYTITVSTNLPGVFDVVGTGSGPYGAYTVSGELMAAPSRKLAGLLIVNYSPSATSTSSVTGQLTGNLLKFDLKGKESDGDRLSVKAQKL